MTDGVSLPFEVFSFTLVEDRCPRTAFRMSAADGGVYELHVEKGSAANPSMQFTRIVPAKSAQRLKDALQGIGVFGWAEAYGNAEGRASRRWSVTTVFKEGVFTVASRGGSEVPFGFDDMLEELYRLDFPRPPQAQAQGAPATGGIGSALGAAGLGSMGSLGSLSVGDLGAYGAARASGGVDFSQMASLLQGGGIPGFDASEIEGMLDGIGRDPEALQGRMREEFAAMAPDEQNRMLDALAATGMASRAWWERFLRGNL